MKRKVGILALMFLLITLISLGYASEGLSSSENKNIYYENVRAVGNVDIYSVDGLDINYSGTLDKPGDYYEVYVDVINASSSDAEVVDVHCNRDDEYLDYDLTYDDGSKVEVGDILKVNEKRTIKYRVYYKDYMLGENIEFDSSFNINYETII